MKTKPLTFLLALTFLFLFSGCISNKNPELVSIEKTGDKISVVKKYWDNGKIKSETHYKDGKIHSVSKFYGFGKKKLDHFSISSS